MSGVEQLDDEDGEGAAGTAAFGTLLCCLRTLRGMERKGLTGTQSHLCRRHFWHDSLLGEAMHCKGDAVSIERISEAS